MADDITVKDFDTQTSRTVRMVDRNGKLYQVVEMPTVASQTFLDLDEGGSVVLAAPGDVHSIEGFNTHTAPLYAKLYNKATTPTTADTPIRVWEFMPGLPMSFEWTLGIACAAGISLRCSTGRAHDDNGAPPTNTFLLNIGLRAKTTA